MIDILESKLEKYDYRYTEEKNSISVYLGHSLYVSVKFNEGGKIRISDQLKPWNPLTGIIPMSIKATMTYNGILLGFIIILVFVSGFTTDSFNIEFVLILAAVWTTLWALYYHIKSENFKRILIDWIDRGE